jgi:hypothetical protein
MQRYFNTTGPCNPLWHYMLPPEARLPALLPYVEQQLYFVVHAARQTGKTTAMRSFAERLRGLGYVAVWATLETSQEITEIEKVELLWLSTLKSAAEHVLPKEEQPPERDQSWSTGDRLRLFLSAWSAKLNKPLVLLLDEADTISGPALISFLRQLRSGFSDRGIGKFPTSIALIGMRDLRDYLTHSKDGVPVNPGSPFNVKKASLTLRNFTLAEVENLYAQHTQETGQQFTPEAGARAFYWTRGQPFLVNALADICVTELASGQPITEAQVNEAKEKLILSRTTHLDALGQRLRELRVMPIIQAVLVGDIPDQIPYSSDDFQYVLDLGLLVIGKDGAEPANPLYQEVLARELSYDRQMSFFRPRFRWQHPDGRLDFPALLNAFFDWWRENEEAVMARGVKEYPEAFPHLTLMAFFQRVLNGGGIIQREFSAARGALDLLITFQGQRFAIEVKRVFQDGPAAEKVKQAGIEQLAEYLDTLNEPEGWLLIFNQRSTARARPWEERLWQETVQLRGHTLYIRGG